MQKVVCSSRVTRPPPGRPIIGGSPLGVQACVMAVCLPIRAPEEDRGGRARCRKAANLGSNPCGPGVMLVADAREAPRAVASAPGPAIGVLALQGDVAEHLAALRAAGSRPVSVRRPGELDGDDGLVIPGGESTPMLKLAVIFDLLEPLRNRIRSGSPAFGSWL